MTTIPHDQIWTTIQNALAQKMIVPVNLTRDGQPHGGMIILGDQVAYEKVVAMFENHCGTAPALPQLEPTEEPKP